jgi:hypothetical protein
MGGKREGERHGPRLVEPGEKESGALVAGRFASFMPKISTADRRMEAMGALGLYESRAFPAIDAAKQGLRGAGANRSDYEAFLAVEMCIHDKLRECCRVVCGSIDPALYTLFSRVAATAAMHSRIIALEDIARAGYDELAPELVRLCKSCGVEPPPEGAADAIRMYSPAVSKKNGE